MSYYAEPYSSRKRRNYRSIFLFLLGLIVVLAVPAYIYGPRLYYLYSGDPILRLEKRARQFEADFQAGGNSPEKMYEFIVDSRRVLSYVEKDNPVRPEIQYYHGLFQFHELLVRLPLTGDSAVRLLGRLYLPEEPSDSPLAARQDLKPIPDLGKLAAQSMRKALALDPDLPQGRAARVVIAFGDLLFTARTDPVLLEYLKDSEEDLPEFFRPYRAWMSLVLLGMRGQVDEMETLLENEDEAPASGPPGQFTAAHLDLIRAFGNFYARRYIKALQNCRRVKSAEDSPVFLRAEATRMEGEIFLVQRGAFAARPYFQEALRLSENKDEFLKERLTRLGE